MDVEGGGRRLQRQCENRGQVGGALPRTGARGPGDRSSRPQRSPCRTGADRVAQVEALRRERWTGLRIALTTGLSRATISRILRRLHLSRMRDLEPAPPVIRYEHAAPGDLLHLDIKKIGRFAAVGCRITGHRQGRIHGQGWEYLHVAIDDHSRIAFSDLLPNQKAASAAAFLWAAVAYYARFGICIRRVLTDNGPCYRSGRFRRACRAVIRGEARVRALQINSIDPSIPAFFATR